MHFGTKGLEQYTPWNRAENLRIKRKLYSQVLRVLHEFEVWSIVNFTQQEKYHRTNFSFQFCNFLVRYFRTNMHKRPGVMKVCLFWTPRTFLGESDGGVRKNLCFGIFGKNRMKKKQNTQTNCLKRWTFQVISNFIPESWELDSNCAFRSKAPKNSRHWKVVLQDPSFVRF